MSEQLIHTKAEPPNMRRSRRGLRGQKPPLKVKEIWAIRIRLQLEEPCPATTRRRGWVFRFLLWAISAPGRGEPVPAAATTGAPAPATSTLPQNG